MVHRASFLLVASVLHLLLTPPTTQAGPLAVIGNAIDSTVTTIDTAVSVTTPPAPRT